MERISSHLYLYLLLGIFDFGTSSLINRWGRNRFYLSVFWRFLFCIGPPVGVQDELELLCYLASTERPAGSHLACVVGSLRPCMSPGPQDWRLDASARGTMSPPKPQRPWLTARADGSSGVPSPGAEVCCLTYHWREEAAIEGHGCDWREGATIERDSRESRKETGREQRF